MKSDVYELALVFYVMVVGRLPWDPEDPQGRLGPRRPSELGVALPPALEDVLMHALAVDMNQRPGSALELSEAIHRSAQGAGPASVHARPSGIPETQLRVTPGAEPHARTEVHVPQFSAPTQLSVSPMAPIHPPRFDGATPPGYTPGQAPTPAGVVAGFSAPPPPARSSSGVALLIAGALIAGAGAFGGAYATGALSFGDRDKTSKKSARRAPSDDESSSPSDEPSADPSAAASPGPRPEVPVPTPSVPTSKASSDKAPTKSPSAAPTASSPLTPTAAPTAAPTAPTASSSPASNDATPPACTALVALMCSPTSGARPEECAQWKENVRRWKTTLPPPVQAETCQAALSQSQKGLAMRKTP